MVFIKFAKDIYKFYDPRVFNPAQILSSTKYIFDMRYYSFPKDKINKFFDLLFLIDSNGNDLDFILACLVKINNLLLFLMFFIDIFMNLLLDSSRLLEHPDAFLRFSEIKFVESWFQAYYLLLSMLMYEVKSVALEFVIYFFDEEDIDLIVFPQMWVL